MGKAKAKAKAAKKKPAADSEDSDDEPAPKTKAKTKAPKKVDSDDDDSDDKPAPKAKAKAKKKRDSDDEDEEEPPAKAPKTKVQVEGKSSEDLTVFVGGLPFSCEEATLRKDFAECGEIERLNMPKNDEGRPKGIAFITLTTDAGVEAALKYNETDYGGRTLRVNKAGDRPPKGDDEMTVFVRGLPWSCEQETLRKDFAECGEIVNLRMTLNEEGRPKGIAFIEYKAKEGVEEALKFNDTEYGGRTIGVSKAGDRPPKGEGKGKDGKGKDKGKGKGKKGKGKSKDGLSSEKTAAKHGAMVESTGKKQTFGDSDDDDE